MFNFIYLVILCLLVAIIFASCYKFLRFKKWSLAIVSFICSLIVIITTLIFFEGRLKSSEVDYLISSLGEGNIFAIIVLLLQLVLCFVTVFDYYQVLKLVKPIKDTK